MGAVTKGRSSLRRLDHVLRQLAALCFCGGLVLHVVFIPTEHNPADHLSRGRPETWPLDLLARSRRANAADHGRPLPRSLARLEGLEHQVAQLREAGWSDIDTSSSDAESW